MLRISYISYTDHFFVSRPSLNISNDNSSKTIEMICP